MKVLSRCEHKLYSYHIMSSYQHGVEYHQTEIVPPVNATETICVETEFEGRRAVGILLLGETKI